MACTNLNFSYSTDQLKLLATLATSDLSNLNHQIRFHQWTSHMTMCIYRIRGIFGGSFNLANQVNIAKLNVRHLGCKHEFFHSVLKIAK